ncbi:hypothetical protein IAT38_006472 [Cryptococcus sp. DSM 104549]
MPSAGYQPLPTASPPSSRPGTPNSGSNPTHRASARTTFPPRPASHSQSDRDADADYADHLRRTTEAEFNRPPPPWWQRALLIVAVIAMGWLAVWLGGRSRQPEVIYASRYSDEYKYRPAASPVITETLPDGRLRIRGASVGGVGVREEDIPLTPAQKQEKERKRREEARDAAREKMGMKVKKRRGKKGKKTEKK